MLSPTDDSDFCVTSIIVVKYPIYLFIDTPAICAELFARLIASAMPPALAAAAISTALCLCIVGYSTQDCYFNPLPFRTWPDYFFTLILRGKLFRITFKPCYPIFLSKDSRWKQQIIMHNNLSTCMNIHYHEYLGFNLIFILTFFLLSSHHTYHYWLRCGVRL